jgi:hypothetical protein
MIKDTLKALFYSFGISFAGYCLLFFVLLQCFPGVNFDPVQLLTVAAMSLVTAVTVSILYYLTHKPKQNVKTIA